MKDRPVYDLSEPTIETTVVPAGHLLRTSTWWKPELPKADLGVKRLLEIGHQGSSISNTTSTTRTGREE